MVSTNFFFCVVFDRKEKSPEENHWAWETYLVGSIANKDCAFRGPSLEKFVFKVDA